MILKDTHTCENHPERFTQWIEIAARRSTGAASSRKGPDRSWERVR